MNLPETVDRNFSRTRRQHIETELVRARLRYRFVNAVDGPRLMANEHTDVVDHRVVAQHPSWLTPGVIGAALSHVQAYREILDAGDRAALILEDDAILGTGLREVLEELGGLLARSEVVLLYWRTWPGCEFSSQQARELHQGQRLLYPLDLKKLVCASAYVITADACETMIEALLPIRAGTDSWDAFHEWGGFECMRCIVPRVVGSRTDLKSTVGYIDAAGIAGRLAKSTSTLIAHRRTFPIYQLLGLRRRRLERQMSMFDVVDKPSPLAR